MRAERAGTVPGPRRWRSAAIAGTARGEASSSLLPPLAFGTARRPIAAFPVESERVRRRVQLAALVENLDAPLRFLQARVTVSRQLHAALVEFERLLERQVALFEPLHGRLEFRDCRFEALDGFVHGVPSYTRSRLRRIR